MKEFKVNEFITLKLEDEKTNIYIKGEKFKQCKYLLLDIPVERVTELEEIESVDEAAEKLGKFLELGHPKRKSLNIPSEVEFWGHCSNLQVWAEYSYDTRLIHSNLAFPLLRKLTELGDPKAKKIYKEEIGKRFQNGPDSVRQFLMLEGFMEFLSREEFWSVVPNQSDAEILQNIERKIKAKFKLCSNKMDEFLWGDQPNQLAFSIKNNYVTRIDFYNFKTIQYSLWRKVFQELVKLNVLKKILIHKCNLKKIPKEISMINNLEALAAYDNELISIPDSIGNLKKLRSLYLEKNEINELPVLIGNLKVLEHLELKNNRLKSIPESITNLKSLVRLSLSNNLLTNIPKSIGKLKLLKVLNLENNYLMKIPNSISNLKSLKSLYLGKNNLEELPKTINGLNSLKVLSIENNKIKSLPNSISRMKELKILNISNNKINMSSEIVEKLKKKRKLTLKI